MTIMENIKVKVSIITPVYNGEAFIDKCFECVKAQTYDNIEWVVINDGSQDGTLSKLEKLAKHFPNLSLVDQQNAGAAEARRSGALKALGEYIVYLDIDDAISEDAIRLAIEKFSENIDIVLFKQIKVGMNTQVDFNMFTDIWPQSGDEVFKACIDGWGAHSFGVYRKSIFLSSYSFLDNFENMSKTYKDELLSRIIFTQSRMIEYCEGTYFYDLNDESVSKKFNPEYYLIANNVHALDKYLTSQAKDISIERMYSRLFFDLLGRYIKWHKDLKNKSEWQTALMELASKVSIGHDFSNSLQKSEYKKTIPRILLIVVYKFASLIRKI
jgi:glycosyltransferase involved in cell wall biosynthesis